MNILPQHLSYFLLFIGITLGLFLISTFVRMIKPRVGYGLIIICGWVIFINILALCDFIGIPVFQTTLAIVFGAVILAILQILRFKDKFKDVYLSHNSFKELTALFIVWLVVLGAISIPLLRIFPQFTAVPGHFVSNDSVVHGLFARGFEFTRSLDIANYYNVGYPRGIHSFLHYASDALNISPVYSLLPGSLFALSFLVFAFESIIEKYKFSFFARLLIMILGASSFLVLASAYQGFLAQIAVIPIVVFGASFILMYKFTKANLLVFALISICVLNIYGVFGLSILGVSFLVKLIQYFFSGGRKNFRQNLQILILELNLRLKDSVWLLPLAILLLPSAFATFNILSLQQSGSVGSDLLSSVGNLPAGFLSPLHLTGSWISTLTYRDYPQGGESGLTYLLLTVFAIQVFFFSRLKSNSLKALTAILLFLNLLTIVVFKNQYLQFKYFTFLIPVFLFSVGVSIYTSLTNKRFAMVIVGVLVIINLLLPLRAYKLIPVLYQFQLSEIEYIDSNYIEKGSALILTKEDWVQYYRSGSDDYYPLTLYLTKDYINQKLDYVIMDKAYLPEITDYLNTNISLRDQLLTKCNIPYAERYLIVDLNCKLDL